MAAQHGKEDGKSQPEADIDCRQEEEDDDPAHLLCRRRDPDDQEAHCPEESSHGVYHDKDQDRSRQEFSVDHAVPVNGLGQKPVQGPAVPFTVDGVKAKHQAHKGPQKGNKGHEGGDGAAACGEQAQEEEFTAAASCAAQLGKGAVQTCEACDHDEHKDQQKAAAADVIPHLLAIKGRKSRIPFPDLLSPVTFFQLRQLFFQSSC